jgi:hypothetical protein
MDHEKLRPATVETCRYRRNVPCQDGAETAACGLLESLLGKPGEAWGYVGRDVCEVCCRSFPPAPANLNSAVASVVFQRARQLAETAPPPEADRLRQLSRDAWQCLDVLPLQPLPPLALDAVPARPLTELVPPLKRRSGRAVRKWAVGVTTAPRIRPTLDTCLESLVRAGWTAPYLFVDSPVRLPEKFAGLPGTFRDTRAGAWSSYYLALAELLLREPHADAYLIVQDDAVFYSGESLPDYLAGALWPGTSPCLVSLYCGPGDYGSRSGWHRPSPPARTGPVAVAFPPDLAKAFLTDRQVFEHRWAPDPQFAAAVDGVISQWAFQNEVPFWFPTPSLVQHVGDTSTLWPHARALGHRRAEQFAGDSQRS